MAESSKIAAGVPLGKLIPRRLVTTEELVMISAPSSSAAERFRRLRTLLVSEHPDAQVIIVTSAAPAEGKSTVSTNLALAFASDPKSRTVLVDADLRRPRLAGWLQPEPAIGLTELLRGSLSLDHALLDLEETRLRAIPSGACAREPLELFTSDRARLLFEELRRRFDRIVVDTPPIIRFTDADALGSLADGVLLVAREGSTPQAAFLQMLSMITSAPVLGTVLNEAIYNLADRHRYASYYEDARYYGEEER